MKNEQSATKSPSRLLNLVIWLFTAGVVIAGFLLISQNPSRAADVVVYKHPTCGCCEKWVDHLQENGFSVEVHDERDMSQIKAHLGVPRHLQSCHTAQVNGYVIEGHVPANDIKRLLDEARDVKGLTVPGMPMGSPGMEGPRKDSYEVLAFGNGGTASIFSSH